MTSGLKMLPSACGLWQHFPDLGHSFSLYGPPSRQITYKYYNTDQLVPRSHTEESAQWRHSLGLQNRYPKRQCYHCGRIKQRITMPSPRFPIRSLCGLVNIYIYKNVIRHVRICLFLHISSLSVWLKKPRHFVIQSKVELNQSLLQIR